MNLLFMLSACRRAVGRKLKAASAWLAKCCQIRPSSEAPIPPASDARRHSIVCCCLRCEQQGTGEQAMRSVGGDYRRFLARVRSTDRLDRSSDEGPALSQNLAQSIGSHSHRAAR